MYDRCSRPGEALQLLLLLLLLLGHSVMLPFFPNCTWVQKKAMQV